MPADRSELAEAKFRSRRRVWAVFLVITLVGAVSYAIWLVALFSSFFSSLPDFPSAWLSDEDRSILICMNDLLAEEEMPTYDFGENAGREPRHDGGVIIFTEGARRIGNGEVRLHCSAHFMSSASDARETLNYMSAVDNPGRRFVDGSIRLGDRPVLSADRFQWGEESELSLLLDGGEPTGIQFTALAGDRVYLFAVSGRDLSDPNLLRMLLLPKLEKFAVYEP